ncbi:hypothetical protein BDP27DRAFT_1024748 [Rhodocollybia butyracea]|uniref:Uncharacterized protein n=1 Tax=Rhodocollybia butyracea TaxID=206335 RepID=A0A9P5PQL2_9AGAR|nr:hypothetical protein BDP27DRAFT_1024748 [Rhodocollybia butyracea]
MSGRPRPLNSPTSATVSAYEPRTPRSRAGFNLDEEAENSRDDHDEEDDDENQSSAAPLLPGSEDYSLDQARKKFETWLGLDRLNPAIIAQRLPVVAGCIIAALFFFLAIVAYGSPGALEFYMGVPANSTKVDSSLFISYANYSSFPLQPTEYVSECYKFTSGIMKPMRYWGEEDMPFMDVVHEEKEGVCSSTITYSLDGRIGLASDLALMAQIAALARDRNRTFLVDDTYWNRGKWTDHFQDVRVTQPGPEPGCLPPPPEELVACPRQARHWVINSHTAKFHLSHMFQDEYEDAYARNLDRLKPIYLHASISLTQTIQPSAQIAALITQARKELASMISSTSSSSTHIGVHIRRGDLKAKFAKGPGGYVAMDDFVRAVQGIKDRFFSADVPAVMLYIGSDDPHAIEDFTSRLTNSESKFNTFSLSTASPSLRILASRKEYVQSEFNNLPEYPDLKINEVESLAEIGLPVERTRVLLTRGMVVDLALMSGLWIPEDGEGEVTGVGKPEATVYHQSACSPLSPSPGLLLLGIWTPKVGGIRMRLNSTG